jgi:hypothetical protein
LIEDVTNSVKTLVRDKLVSEATIEDFQHIRGK